VYRVYRYEEEGDRSFALVRRKFLVDGAPEAVWEYGRDPIHFDQLSIPISDTYRDGTGVVPLLGKFPTAEYESVSFDYSNPPRVFEIDPDGNATIYYLYEKEMDQYSESIPYPRRYGTIIGMDRLRGSSLEGMPLVMEDYHYQYDLFDYPEYDANPTEDYARPENIRKYRTARAVFADDFTYPATITKLSEFDEYGHYQTETEYELFSETNVYRQSHTKYAVADGNPDLADITASSGDLQQELIDRWILHPTTSTTLRKGDPGDTLKKSRVLAMDPFGLALTIEAYGDPTAETGAVTTVNTPDAYGRVEATTVSNMAGGEPHSRTTSFELDVAGHVTGKFFGSLSWEAFDRDVHVFTGLVTATRTPAGVETTYNYDDLGRLTAITPSAGELASYISYPSLDLTIVSQGGSGNQIYGRYEYDQAGRLISHGKIGREGELNFKTFQYDVGGRKVFESEWYRQISPGGTTYDYRIPIGGTVGPVDPGANPDTYTVDPLGRVTRMTTADGAVTERAYDAFSETVTLMDLNRLPGSTGSPPPGRPALSTAVFDYDAFGRLVHVIPAEGAEAFYEYDEQDNLVQVMMDEQVRRFAYDPLGRLRSALHPENGWTRFESFDPSGLVLKQTDQANTEVTFKYDDAGRILEETVGGDVLRKRYLYDEQMGDGLSKAEARLTSVRSYNDSGAFEVRRDFFYAGLNGRLSSERWTFSGPEVLDDALTTSYEYNNFGLVSAIDYPERQPEQHLPTRVTYGYVNGFLGTVSDGATQGFFLEGADYNPAGGVQDLRFGNGTETEITPDARNRPSQIVARIPDPGSAFNLGGGADTLVAQTEAAGERRWNEGWVWKHPLAGTPPDPRFPEPLPTDLVAQIIPLPGGGGGGGVLPMIDAWDSGPYAYDGAGNIIAIGDDQFEYDGVSRLVAAHVTYPDAMTNNYADLAYAYDGYGNMTRREKSVDLGTAFFWDFTVTPGNHILHLQHDCLTGNCTTEPDRDFQYDDVGNVTFDGVRNYMFDTASHLQEVRDQTGETLGVYGYDDRGYRVRKVENGVETIYLRDTGGRVLSEYRRPAGSTSPPVWDQDYVYALGNAISLIKNEQPLAPRHLMTRLVGAQNDDVELTWDRNDETDIQGYRVYRDTGLLDPLGTGITIAQPAAGVEGLYTDGDAGSGTPAYFVTTVDTAGNESAPSRQLTVDTAGPSTDYVVSTSSRSQASRMSIWLTAKSTSTR
jgi:YD repeat-containing protein